LLNGKFFDGEKSREKIYEDLPVLHTFSGETRGRLSPPPPKIYESNFFTMILYNSENSIRDVRPFCHPLFRHSRVVK